MTFLYELRIRLKNLFQEGGSKYTFSIGLIVDVLRSEGVVFIGKVAFLEIVRDSLVDVPGLSVNSINSASGHYWKQHYDPVTNTLNCLSKKIHELDYDFSNEKENSFTYLLNNTLVSRDVYIYLSDDIDLIKEIESLSKHHVIEDDKIERKSFVLNGGVSEVIESGLDRLNQLIDKSNFVEEQRAKILELGVHFSLKLRLPSKVKHPENLHIFHNYRKEKYQYDGLIIYRDHVILLESKSSRQKNNYKMSREDSGEGGQMLKRHILLASKLGYKKVHTIVCVSKGSKSSLQKTEKIKAKIVESPSIVKEILSLIKIIDSSNAPSTSKMESVLNNIFLNSNLTEQEFNVNPDKFTENIPYLNGALGLLPGVDDGSLSTDDLNTYAITNLWTEGKITLPGVNPRFKDLVPDKPFNFYTVSKQNNSRQIESVSEEVQLDVLEFLEFDSGISYYRWLSRSNFNQILMYDDSNDIDNTDKKLVINVKEHSGPKIDKIINYRINNKLKTILVHYN